MEASETYPLRKEHAEPDRPEGQGRGPAEDQRHGDRRGDPLAAAELQKRGVAVPGDDRRRRQRPARAVGSRQTRREHRQQALEDITRGRGDPGGAAGDAKYVGGADVSAPFPANILAGKPACREVAAGNRPRDEADAGTEAVRSWAPRVLESHDLDVAPGAELAIAQDDDPEDAGDIPGGSQPFADAVPARAPGFRPPSPRRPRARRSARSRSPPRNRRGSGSGRSSRRRCRCRSGFAPGATRSPMAPPRSPSPAKMPMTRSRALAR